MKKVLRGPVPPVFPNYQMVKSINDFMRKNLWYEEEK